MLKYILISFLIITNAYAYTCEEMGYTKSIADCPEGGLKCPAQPEKMFCCDPCGSGYYYNEKNCSSDDGLYPAGFQCGGKWTECRSCTSEYKYTKDNCRSPKILAGSQCGNAYTECVYPSNIGCVSTVGYIYYADGSCHSGYDESKEAIGIIYDASNHLVLSLDEKKLQFITDYVAIGKFTSLPPLEDLADAQLDMNGQSNTNMFYNFAIENNFSMPAIEYCTNKTTGNKKWFVPSLGQMFKVADNLEKIQAALELTPNTTKISNISYSTSTRRHPSTNWYINPFTLTVNQQMSSYTYTYRCSTQF